MYKNKILSAGIILIISIVVSACAGLAAISGSGGTVAEFDSLAPTIKDVSTAKYSYPRTSWESIIPHEGADLIYFINKNRVMVGTVESGSYLGLPDHKQIIMYNANTGAKIWETERDSFNNGGFGVYKTRPYILILGKNRDKAQLMALDPETGGKLWEKKFESPDQTVVSDDATKLYMLNIQGPRAAIKAIDSNTGAVLWNTPLSNILKQKKSAAKLLLNNTGLYIASNNLTRIDPVTGNIQWNSSHSLLANSDNGVMLSEQNIILWSKNKIALINTKNGKQIWHKTYKKSGTKLITYKGDRIYRVINDATNNKSTRRDILQSIRINNGKLAWSIKTDSAFSSPLIFKNKKIIFSTEKSAYVLVAKNGNRLLKDKFSKEFSNQSPSQAKLTAQVDLIHFRSNKFYISREKAGIIAYSLKKSRKLWQQMHHTHTRDEYSADARSQAMIISLTLHGQTTKQPQIKQSNIFDTPSANSPLQASQRSAEFMKQRADRTLRNRNASRLERKSAFQTKTTAAELSLANTQTQIASEQLASAAQLANALLGLQQALEESLKEAAINGMVSRIQLTQYSADYMRARRFQGKYYVRALYDNGRGVTLIDLDNGKRSDFLFSPHIDVLFGNGLDLQSFAINPDNKQLITVAVGLDDTKYKEYVKWKHRLPMTSVLSFDISKLKFNRKNKLISLVSFRDYQARIHQLAGFGDLAGVKIAIKSGVDINIIIHNTTPLNEAAMTAHVEIVKLLLENGADVTLRDPKGRSAVDVTYDGAVKQLLSKTHKQHQNNYIKIRQLLFNAGAKDSPPEVKSLDVQKTLSKNEEKKQAQQSFIKVAGLGYLEEVKSMLKNKDLKIAAETKETALVSAASIGQIEVLRYLLKIGISPNAKNSHGESAYKAATIAHESLKGNVYLKDMANNIATAMRILEKAGGK